MTAPRSSIVLALPLRGRIRRVTAVYRLIPPVAATYWSEAEGGVDVEDVEIEGMGDDLTNSEWDDVVEAVAVAVEEGATADDDVYRTREAAVAVARREARTGRALVGIYEDLAGWRIVELECVASPPRHHISPTCALCGERVEAVDSMPWPTSGPTWRRAHMRCALDERGAS